MVVAILFDVDLTSTAGSYDTIQCLIESAKAKWRPLNVTGICYDRSHQEFLFFQIGDPDSRKFQAERIENY